MLDGSQAEAKTIIAALDKTNVVLLWPQIEKLLAPLLETEGNYVPADILAYHLRDEMLIFIAWGEPAKEVEAIMVTQTITYPRRKICAVPYIAGKNMDVWKDDFIRLVEDYARRCGCNRMSNMGRLGWVRVAGYKDVGHLLMKDLV